jgi:hypothetical protein
MPLAVTGGRALLRVASGGPPADAAAATAPQPVFVARVSGGIMQVCLPDARVNRSARLSSR